jgi:tetrahydromethanopterin S-methyltransferase subunit G
MPMELLSLIGGSATGFLFRFLAQKSQDQKEIFQQLLEANKQTTNNQNEAAQRVGIDVGRGVRQLIVLSVLFATFLAPFVLPFFGVPTFVEVDATQTNLLGPDMLKKYFVEINGYLFTSENRQILLSIVGFYFGSAAASNKS